MSQHNAYDPGRVVLNFAGILIQGFASGTFIQAEANEDVFNVEPGAVGDTVRVRSHNATGLVTVTLMMNSPVNDLLYARLLLDKATGLGKGPLFGKDLNGTMSIECTDAWIKRNPSIERGTESSTVEWIFECADLELGPGGLVL
jgi:hypothetical protein